jgi:hypothetical protein
MNRGLLLSLALAAWLATDLFGQNGYQQPYQDPNQEQADYPPPSQPEVTSGARRDPYRPPAIPPAEMYQRVYPQGFHPYVAIPRRCTACECCNDPHPPCINPTTWTFLDTLCDLKNELCYGVLDPCCAMDCCEGSTCHNRSFGLIDLVPYYRNRKLAERHGCGGPAGGPGVPGVANGGCSTCGGSGYVYYGHYGHAGYGTFTGPNDYVGCLEQYHVPRGWAPAQSPYFAPAGTPLQPTAMPQGYFEYSDPATQGMPAQDVPPQGNPNQGYQNQGVPPQNGAPQNGQRFQPRNQQQPAAYGPQSPLGSQGRFDPRT